MIRVDDKITIITSHNNVLHVNVVAVWKNGSFRATTSWLYEHYATEHDEGVTWIRDWHDENSPEIAALRTASALSKRDPWANSFIESRD